MGVDRQGTPILLKHMAHIHLGPELRRGILEWDGGGEAVGGIVIIRSGENALQVIENVKRKLKELRRGLPAGVVIEEGYNRADLILSAIHTLKSKLMEEMTVVALICLLFLLHFRSAFVAIFTLPVGILMAFIAMKLLGINANIMSLSGIAIAIGVMVDASVVLVENAHKHLARDTGKKSHTNIILDSAKEVGPALFLQPAHHHRLLSARVQPDGRVRATVLNRSPTPRPLPWRHPPYWPSPLFPVLMDLFCPWRDLQSPENHPAAAACHMDTFRGRRTRAGGGRGNRGIGAPRLVLWSQPWWFPCLPWCAWCRNGLLRNQKIP